jgi:hypothetical protein
VSVLAVGGFGAYYGFLGKKPAPGISEASPPGQPEEDFSTKVASETVTGQRPAAPAKPAAAVVTARRLTLVDSKGKARAGWQSTRRRIGVGLFLFDGANRVATSLALGDDNLASLSMPVARGPLHVIDLGGNRESQTPGSPHLILRDRRGASNVMLVVSRQSVPSLGLRTINRSDLSSGVDAKQAGFELTLPSGVTGLGFNAGGQATVSVVRNRRTKWVFSHGDTLTGLFLYDRNEQPRVAMGDPKDEPPNLAILDATGQVLEKIAP